MHGLLPQLDQEQAINFLRQLRPGGPWVLTAIVPDGPTVTETFAINDGARLSEFIQAQNTSKRKNVYYTINPVHKPSTRKPSKSDILAGEFLQLDADPAEDETSDHFKNRFIPVLRAFSPMVTAIVDSGNGIQCLWRLDELTSDIAAVENANKALLEALGAPKGTHNVDRLFRLPGTINWPNGKKRTAGRVACPSALIEFNDLSHSLGDFPITRAESTTYKRNISERTHLKLPRHLETLLRLVEPSPYPSRSELLFAFVTGALRANIGESVVLSALLDKNYVGKSIYEHVTENGGHDYARRQIEKAIDQIPAFELDSHGKPLIKSQANICTALDKLGIKLRYNEFDGRMTVFGLRGFDLLDDAAIERLWLMIDDQFKFLPPKDFFWTVVSDAARRNSFHPVRAYLDDLKWDGIKRIDRWLITYGQASDTPYVRSVGRLVLIAAVRRIRQPGCKFDEMVILESSQGTDKSNALETLAVNPDWFSDDLPLGSDSKRMIEHLRGRWIVEAAELNGMRKTDVGHMKAFLSRRVDRARMAFGRMPTELLRQCIVFGSTNDNKYLRDQTGNRRYWPVTIKAFNTSSLKLERDQLWAEAAHLEAQGASIRLDPELWKAAATEQTERTIDEPWIEEIAGLLGDMEGKLLAADAWALIGLPAGQRTQEHNARFGKTMRELGWERKKLRFDGKLANGYVKGDGKQTVLKRIVVTRISQYEVTASYEGQF